MNIYESVQCACNAPWNTPEFEWNFTNILLLRQALLAEASNSIYTWKKEARLFKNFYSSLHYIYFFGQMQISE